MILTDRKQIHTDKKLILEKEFMPKVFETQLLHYLKTTGYKQSLRLGDLRKAIL